MESGKFGRVIRRSNSATVRKSIFIRAQQDLLELMGYMPHNYNSVKYMGKRDRCLATFVLQSLRKEKCGDY